MAFVRADLANLNKKGITFLSLHPQLHYDRKRGEIYGDCQWMYRHSWSTNKGYI